MDTEHSHNDDGGHDIDEQSMNSMHLGFDEVNLNGTMFVNNLFGSNNKGEEIE